MDEKVSAELSQGFTDLRNDVSGFQTKWKSVVEKHNLNAINNQIAELNKIVGDLQDTFDEYVSPSGTFTVYMQRAQFALVA